jgi:hypothetical protein
VTDVRVEVTVPRPRADVARYAADWRNDTEWIGALTEASPVTEPPRPTVRDRTAPVATFAAFVVEDGRPGAVPV